MTTKRITLHTARVDNCGSRRPAGAELMVGKKADQISNKMALDYIDRSMAVDTDAEAVRLAAIAKREAEQLKQSDQSSDATHTPKPDAE